MIGKQAKGKGFRGLLEYLESKEEAEIIGSNMLGSDARSLAAEFKVSRQLNPRLNKAVYHCSLSLPHHENLSNKQWLSFCQDYLEGMGFDDNQYVIYRHSDLEEICRRQCVTMTTFILWLPELGWMAAQSTIPGTI